MLNRMEVWPGSLGHIRRTLGRGYLLSIKLYSSDSPNSITWSTSDPLHYFTISTYVEIYLYAHALITSKDIHRRKNAEGRREQDIRKGVRKEEGFQRGKFTETSGREHDII